MSAADCDMLMLTQAEFDNELDAAQALEAARHRASCAACQAAHDELVRVRTVLQAEGFYQRAPATLRAALASMSAPRPARPIAGEGARRWWHVPALNFGLGAAAAAAIALMASWSSGPVLIDQIVDDHIRALQPGHLSDVISEDRHTVKPWFDGRIDFAPPVKDLADRQFPLRGGRLDYLGGRTVAALVYEHGKHPIDLFVWPAASGAPVAPALTLRKGYSMVHWTEGGMTYWAVSDLEASQLLDFAALWRSAP